MFSYYNVAEDIYYFSYDDYEEIHIENNEILLHRKTNNKLNINKKIKQLEKQFRSKYDIYINKNYSSLFLNKKIYIKKINDVIKTNKYFNKELFINDKERCIGNVNKNIVDEKYHIIANNQNNDIYTNGTNILNQDKIKNIISRKDYLSYRNTINQNIVNYVNQDYICSRDENNHISIDSLLSNFKTISRKKLEINFDKPMVNQNKKVDNIFDNQHHILDKTIQHTKDLGEKYLFTKNNISKISDNIKDYDIIFNRNINSIKESQSMSLNRTTHNALNENLSNMDNTMKFNKNIAHKIKSHKDLLSKKYQNKKILDNSNYGSYSIKPFNSKQIISFGDIEDLKISSSKTIVSNENNLCSMKNSTLKNILDIKSLPNVKKSTPKNISIINNVKKFTKTFGDTKNIHIDKKNVIHTQKILAKKLKIVYNNMCNVKKSNINSIYNSKANDDLILGIGNKKNIVNSTNTITQLEKLKNRKIKNDNNNIFDEQIKKAYNDLINRYDPKYNLSISMNKKIFGEDKALQTPLELKLNKQMEYNYNNVFNEILLRKDNIKKLFNRNIDNLMLDKIYSKPIYDSTTLSKRLSKSNLIKHIDLSNNEHLLGTNNSYSKQIKIDKTNCLYKDTHYNKNIKLSNEYLLNFFAHKKINIEKDLSLDRINRNLDKDRLKMEDSKILEQYNKIKKINSSRLVDLEKKDNKRVVNKTTILFAKNSKKNTINTHNQTPNIYNNGNKYITEERDESFGKLYKSLWFIKGIGSVDYKILPNIDYGYPANIDIFVEKPSFNYYFEYGSKFDKYFDGDYTIELYDYNYNMVSTLSIPKVKPTIVNNDIIKLTIKEEVLNNIDYSVTEFKFKIEIKYDKLNYIIVRQPTDNFLNSVLYTVTERFLGENRHPIPFGKDLGTKEIPIHINIMVEFINILLLMWQYRFLAFSGQVGIQAIYGLVNLVYEWLTLETSQQAEFIDEYYRCFRWLRWEAEKTYNIAKADPKLNGNKWIYYMINEMIDYMEMHHVDVIPIIEDIRKTHDWRNVFSDPTFDIQFMLDKFKGDRKRIISNKNRTTSARMI